MNIHETCKYWILENKELTPEEQKTFESHLAACEECRNLQEHLQASMTCIRKSALVKPQPGFTRRFQKMFEQRIQEQQKLFKRRVILGVMAAVGMLSFSIIVISIFSQSFTSYTDAVIQLISKSIFQMNRLEVLFTVLKKPLLIAGSIGAVFVLFYMILITFSAVILKHSRKGEETL